MSSVVRFTKSDPCPVCGGGQDDPRGYGTRCGGYRSGTKAYCTNTEYANGLPLHGSSGAYAHELRGRCGCRSSHETKPVEVATYDYCDAAGKLSYQVVRFDPKGFAQRRPNETSGWIWNMDGVARLPYRLPELRAAGPSEVVFIPEGEKDVDRLRSVGCVATTNSEGAGRWRAELNTHLANRSVVILPDSDEPGRRHAEAVAAQLVTVAASVKVLLLADLPAKGDVSDWLDAGHSVDELRDLADALSPWQPQRSAAAAGDLDESDPTDVGNARRLAARHGADLKFSRGKGWLVWDAVRWASSEAEVIRRAEALTDEMKRRAAAEPDREKSKKEFNWALQSQSASRIHAMVELAKSERAIEIRDEQLDADPWLINCVNGTLDLRTGELREHRREDAISKLCPVGYDPAARSARWEQFIEETTGRDPELHDYLQRAAGYSLTGSTTEENLFFVYGPAQTGKSTFLAALKTVFGDYAVTADFETFLAKKFGGGTRNDVARLAGARFVSSIEVEEGQKLAEAIVKELTGGDTVSARFLWKEYFEFKPQFKLWLCANHQPRVRSDDDAIWRRIRVLPFVNVVPAERRDRNLKAELTDIAHSGPAILAWLVEGCRRWQVQGLNPPRAVVQATQDYREEMDPLRDFIEGRCVVESSASVLKQVLYAVYSNWAKDAGIKYPLKRKDFGQRLVRRGIQEAPGHSDGRRWLGIGLADDPEREKRY